MLLNGKFTLNRKISIVNSVPNGDMANAQNIKLFTVHLVP